MAISSALWYFALVVGFLTLTPGLDTALILRTSALGRRRRAWGVVLGIQTGTMVWGAFTSLGVTALLTASHLAYTALRWIGAAYLIWMGFRMVRDTFRGLPPTNTDDSVLAAGADSVSGGWRQGTLTNLLNPKMGAFYVAVLPQFIPSGTGHFTMGLLLTTVHILIGLLWSAVLIGFARVLQGGSASPRPADCSTGSPAPSSASSVSGRHSATDDPHVRVQRPAQRPTRIKMDATWSAAWYVMASLSVRRVRPRHCLSRAMHRSTALRSLYRSASKPGGRAASGAVSP